MHAGPPLRSSSIFLFAGLAQLTGCFLDSSPFGTDATGSGGTGGTATTTTTSAAGGAGGATTTSTTSTSGNGGSGGMTTTTAETTGGGGTGGTTTTDTMGGGGTGGTTTTTTTDTTPTTPTSCKNALESGVLTMSGVITIDPDGMGPEMPLEVYCDQMTDGGGWALVYSSIGTENPGVTTAFWNIAYELRLETKVDPPDTPPAPSKNCYVGRLYRYGKQYRDDVVDTAGTEVKGALRAKATGINEVTMKLQGAAQELGNLSTEIYSSQFAAGWSAPGAMNDHDPNPTNCADDWQSVTQHYGGCWYYSLGASTLNSDAMVTDTLDSGWGPHIINGTIKQINMALPMGSTQLVTVGGLNGQASRVNRISRFTRW